MEKLKMHSPNFVDENIEKLASLFPGCVTEVQEEGTTKGTKNTKLAIDWDLLRQELSDHIVEGPQERYHLNWPGKREALLTANAPIAKTLRPCREESVDFDTTENFFIEGDNLDALKLLQETYLGKIKMIYIDPPYNTGKDFLYADNFAETTDEYLLDSGQKDEEGNRLVANSDSNGRFHSDWLSMMYSRLKLAKNLLRDDGLICISVDDGEVDNLRKLCNEIFGSKCFIAQLIWKARKFVDARALNGVSTDHEYLMLYGKSLVSALRGVPRDESKYQNPDNDPRGPWMSRSILGLATQDQRPNLHYNITDPKTGTSYSPPPTTGWRYGKNRMQELINNDSILFPQKTTGRPREKKYRVDILKDFTPFPSIISNVHTSDGTLALRKLFKGQMFDFPKPTELIKELVIQCASKNGFILDFFAGSATTAHAVMQLNAEDQGNRKFIMVQLPEACDEKTEAFKAGYKNIAEISKERIRRAGRKIKDSITTESTEKHGKEKNEPDLFGEADPSVSSVSSVVKKNLDIGFRVLKIDSSNMEDVYYSPDAVEQDLLNLHTDNIKGDRSSEDLLFQVLLDWGVDLTLPITKENIDGLEVFFVDKNALAACFVKAGKITEDFCKKLAESQPLRVVFRDSGFKDDSVKINVEQIFKLMSPHTDVKTI